MVVCGFLYAAEDQKQERALYSEYGSTARFMFSRFTNYDLSQKRLTGVALIPCTSWVMIGTHKSGIKMLNAKNMETIDLVAANPDQQQLLETGITSVAGANCGTRGAFATTSYLFAGTVTPSKRNRTCQVNLGGCSLKSIVHSMAFDPTDSIVAGGCDDGSVQIWGIERVKSICVLGKSRLACPERGVPVVALAFLDTPTLCYNSPFRGIVIHDLRSKEKTIVEDQHTGLVRAISASIFHNFIVSGGGDGMVRLYDIRKPKMIYKSFPTKSSSPITSLAFCSPFQEFLVGQEDGGCSLRRVNKKCIGHGRDSAHAAAVSAIATSDLTPGYFAASVGWDGAINFYGSKSMSLEKTDKKDSNKKDTRK